MSEAPRETWAEANQRRRMAALESVRRALERHAAPDEGPGEAGAEPGREPSGAYALDFLCEAFGLSPFERSMLLLS